LRYFMAKQAPEKVAADLAHRRRVAVARQPVYAGGYSFGAEVVPDVVGTGRRTSGAARRLLLLAPS
jgi:type IV secretory pathway VirJ component